jgi:hypothetical protein
MDDFISPFEVEHIVSTLKEIDIEQYGSGDFYKQHEATEKLNV